MMIKSSVYPLMIAVLCAINMSMPEKSFAGEEKRVPPPTRPPNLYDDPVLVIIDEFQRTDMSPQDYERVLEKLDQLYEKRYHQMNDFEKATVLNFYINHYLQTGKWDEARQNIMKLLAIENLRERTRIRAQETLDLLNSGTYPNNH